MISAFFLHGNIFLIFFVGGKGFGERMSRFFSTSNINTSGLNITPLTTTATTPKKPPTEERPKRPGFF